MTNQEVKSSLEKIQFLSSLIKLDRELNAGTRSEQDRKQPSYKLSYLGSLKTMAPIATTGAIFIKYEISTCLIICRQVKLQMKYKRLTCQGFTIAIFGLFVLIGKASILNSQYKIQVRRQDK